MSTDDEPAIPFTETHQRVLDVLAGVHDALVDSAVEQGYYSGPDAAAFAKNQVDRELHDLLVSLVHARREAPEAQGGEP